MMDGTKIQWTDSTWNPVRGCSKVSEGCRLCYAEAVAGRFNKPGQPYEGLARAGRWTGKVRLVPEHLEDPLRWRRPRRIFVNSMSDMFHDALPSEAIDRIFAVMALAPHHTFQVLTKRPERMRQYVQGLLDASPKRRAALLWLGLREFRPRTLDDVSSLGWPLPNVHLGVSVEDQRTADNRIPLLLQTPAAVRWISAEPLLGPVDLAGQSGGNDWLGDPRDGTQDESGLDWVVCGGESGPGARPCDVRWIRSIVQQCCAARVPVFVKQLGAKPYETDPDPTHGHFPCSPSAPYQMARRSLALRDRKGGDPAEWPEDLRVREFPA